MVMRGHKDATAMSGTKTSHLDSDQRAAGKSSPTVKIYVRQALIPTTSDIYCPPAKLRGGLHQGSGVAGGGSADGWGFLWRSLGWQLTPRRALASRDTRGGDGRRSDAPAPQETARGANRDHSLSLWERRSRFTRFNRPPAAETDTRSV